MRKLLGLGALAGFIGSVFGANYAINRFGVVPVGFGLMAPAGVYVIGAGFMLRDAVQRTLGKRAAIAGIVAGAGLSALVSPALAVASGVAFAASELVDFGTYTALQKRTLLGALAASGVVGAAVDSYLFLQLAFGSQDFFLGNFVGKLTMVGAAVLLLAAARTGYRRLATA